MRRRRGQRAEIWLGLLVLVSAALLTWGYFWLTGQPIGERGYNVTVVLENAGGLASGDRVRISGVEVGSVRDLDLAPDGRVFVRLHLTHAVRLPRDSRATLQSAGVFGDRFIELRLGSAESAVEPGDTLTAGTASTIMEMADELGKRTESVLARVERLLADSTIDQAHGGVAALETTLRDLQELVGAHGDEFARISENLSRTAEKLNASLDGQAVERTVADMERTASRMAETAESLRSSARSLESVSAKIDGGQGTLGRLVNDQALYEDLQSTVRSIGDLTRDIQANPGRYLKFAVF